MLWFPTKNPGIYNLSMLLFPGNPKIYLPSLHLWCTKYESLDVS